MEMMLIVVVILMISRSVANATNTNIMGWLFGHRYPDMWICVKPTYSLDHTMTLHHYVSLWEASRYTVCLYM